MSGALRSEVDLGPILAQSAEVNKYIRFQKALKVGANQNSFVTAQRTVDNDRYTFNVLALNYNQVAPNPMLRSKWRITIDGTGKFGTEEGSELEDAMIKCFTGFALGDSSIGFRPCPVNRLVETGLMEFGASTAESISTTCIDDIISSYPSEDYDTDLGFAGAGALAYGKVSNVAVGGISSDEPTNLTRTIEITVVEPLILFPSLLGGDTCGGTAKHSAFQGLANFQIRLALQGLQDLAYLKQKLLPPDIIRLGAVTNLEMTDLNMEVNLTLANTFTWSLSRQTIIPYLYAYTSTYAMQGNAFTETLPQSVVMWSKMSISAYRVDNNGYEIPCRIKTVKLRAVNTAIKGMETFSFERLYMISKKNGLCKLNGNNHILNTLGVYTIMVDVEDISMAQVQVLSGDTVAIQNWSVSIETAGSPTVVNINRYVNGLANLSSGTFVSEPGLWEGREISTLSAAIDDKVLPIASHHGNHAHSSLQQSGGGFLGTIAHYAKKWIPHIFNFGKNIVQDPEALGAMADTISSGRKVYQKAKAAVAPPDEDNGVPMKRARMN